MLVKKIPEVQEDGRKDKYRHLRERGRALVW